MLQALGERAKGFNFWTEEEGDERGSKTAGEKGEEPLNVELPAPCNLLWESRREEESGGGEYPAGWEQRRAEAIHSDTHTLMQTHI